MYQQGNLPAFFLPKREEKKDLVLELQFGDTSYSEPLGIVYSDEGPGGSHNGSWD